MSVSADPISAASASALADLSTVNSNPSGGESATAGETPTTTQTVSEGADPAETTPTETPISDAQQQATAEQAQRELELIWRGQKVRLPESEAIALAQKGYDYSQKTAELSAFRQELLAQKAQIEQQANDLRQVLTDPQQLRQLVQWAAQQEEVVGLDPNQGVTAQQAEQLIAANVQKVQQQMQTEIKRAQLELETNRLEQEYNVTIGQHMNGLMQKHPVLQDVEGIDGLLKREALAYQQAQLAANPGREVTVHEILNVMAKAAERRAQKIEARFTNQLKQRAVQQANVVNKGIEPGGNPPGPKPEPSYKLNSKELREQVLRDLGAI